MKIEPMCEENSIVVTELARQLGYPNDVKELAERFAQIKRLAGYGLFVAKGENDQVVGWIQVNKEPATLLVGPRAEIAALVVHEDHRDRGVGKALVLHAERWAKAQGLKVIRVRSSIRREDAHRFYRREGFELSKTSHMFTKNLEEE